MPSEGGSTHQQETAGSKDFKGEIFVTSNDDGLTIWMMRSGHKKEQVASEDAVSDVSSISNRTKDIESGTSAQMKQRASSSPLEDSKDQNIRQGASIAINAL